MKRVTRLLAALGALTLGVQDATPASAPVLMDDIPLPTYWAPPVYPPQLAKEKPQGRVKVRFILDAQGQLTTARVLESNDPRLEETALATVKSWKFKPTLEFGEPVACCEDVTVRFSPAAMKPLKPGFMPPFDLLPELAPRTEVQEKTTPPGDYPAILTERRIQGAVTFSCTVGADGRVVDPRVTGTSHVEFVLPGLEALNHWEFTPAQQGDLPVKSVVEAR